MLPRGALSLKVGKLKNHKFKIRYLADYGARSHSHDVRLKRNQLAGILGFNGKF